MTRTAFSFLCYGYDVLSVGTVLLVLVVDSHSLIVCTGIINAYNFMDGINGITGGYSLVILAALAYINKEVVTFVEADFIYTVICSVLVFCFFNFRKKAKCFAGDVGSVSIAFILLFLIGRLIIETEDFSWIVLLSVYGVDSVLTIIHRLMLHENIGLPHRKHLYQIMANELKIPHVMVSSIYMAVQAIIIVGIYNVFRLRLLVFDRYNSFALFFLYLLYEEVFRIAPVYVSNTEMMISKIMKCDGD